jgi:hypothetical protein
MVMVKSKKKGKKDWDSLRKVQFIVSLLNLSFNIVKEISN